MSQAVRQILGSGGPQRAGWISLSRLAALPTSRKAVPALAPESQSDLVTARISEYQDWQAEIIARARELIRETLPNVVEEIKWRKPSNPAGVPVWSHNGIICTGEGFKDKVKLTFAKGAKIDDPNGMFNGSMGGNTMRAIDMRQGDRLDESAFKALVRAAADFNSSKS